MPNSFQLIANEEEEEMKPKRPLTAYNYFFKSERARLLGYDEDELDSQQKKKRKHRKTHGMIGFKELAHHVGETWKNLDSASKAIYQRKFEEDRKRYQQELQVWEKMKGEKSASSINEVSSDGSKDVQAAEPVKSSTSRVLAEAMLILKDDVPSAVNEDTSPAADPRPLNTGRRNRRYLQMDELEKYDNPKDDVKFHNAFKDLLQSLGGDKCNTINEELLKDDAINGGIASQQMVTSIQPLDLVEMSPTLMDLEKELIKLLGEDLILKLSQWSSYTFSYREKISILQFGIAFLSENHCIAVKVATLIGYKVRTEYEGMEEWHSSKEVLSLYYCIM